MKPSMEFHDAHLHLSDERIFNDIDSIIEQCQANGITRMATNGVCQSDWQKVLQIAKRYPCIVANFGLHPWYVTEKDDNWFEQLKEFLNAIPSGVGEIGLDKWIEPRDEKLQEEVFIKQFMLACELDRPISIHCLRAWGWLIELLEKLPRCKAMIIHGYGGSAQTIQQLAKYNAYFSFAGSVLRENKFKARQALLAVRLDRLLIETDAPDIPPPRKFKLQQTDFNHPANLRMIYNGIADILKIPCKELQDITKENFYTVFDFAK